MVTAACDGGCGKVVRAKRFDIIPAQYYVCGHVCEAKLPAPESYQVRIVECEAFGKLFGVIDRFPTREERQEMGIFLGASGRSRLRTS